MNEGGAPVEEDQALTAVGNLEFRLDVEDSIVDALNSFPVDAILFVHKIKVGVVFLNFFPFCHCFVISNSFLSLFCPIQLFFDCFVTFNSFFVSLFCHIHCVIYPLDACDGCSSEVGFVVKSVQFKNDF